MSGSSVNPAGRDKLTDEPDIIQYTGKPMNFGASLSWLAAEGSDSDHTDGKVADEAIRLMEEKKDQPFFLAVGFYKPHTPYVEGHVVRQTLARTNNFGQAGARWRAMEEWEREDLVSNLVHAAILPL